MQKNVKGILGSTLAAGRFVLARFAMSRTSAPAAASQRHVSARGMVALLAVVAGLQASPAFAQLSCGPVYASNLAGDIYTTANNGNQTYVGSVTGLTGNVNPFGIAPGGC